MDDPLINLDILGLKRAVDVHTHTPDPVIVVAQASTTGLTCVCVDINCSFQSKTLMLSQDGNNCVFASYEGDES